MMSLFPILAASAPTVDTERTLVFLGGGATWLEVGVWALGALVIAMTVVNHRRLQPPRRRAVMVGLRVLLVGVLLLFFYQPAFLEERVAKNKNAVIFVADTSESMALPHQKTTRGALAADWLERHRDALGTLGEDHDVHFLTFGEGVGELPDPRTDWDKAAAALVPHESGTRFLDALKDLRARFRNQDVGAVVLLTDGIDTTPEGRRVEPSAELQAVLRDLAAPVTILGTAGDSGIKDIAVASLAANNFAFLLNATSIEAVIEVHGYANGQFPVRLLENGTELGTQIVVARTGETLYRVKFEFVPKTLGKQVYTVALDPVPDEIYAKNDQRSVIINIVRDKIRVVQIVGQPSWDERHLRNLLKENPNVDLVSFFILVSQMGMGARPLSSRETSLIPFPAKELFEDELGGFDLLVFQNFNYGPFQTREYLPNIAEFVRKGGAFIMVGGPLSFTAGGYYGTEITGVLPIDIPQGWGDGAAIDEQVFQPHLSESGGFHPITRLAIDPGQNEAIWNDLQPLEGVNQATSVPEDSVVLVEHPTLKMANGKPQPVVAVREVGEGRSMAVMTDSTWFWSFKAGEGGDPHHYQQFWDNAIRWLIKDPELDLIRVRALRENVPVGDEVEVLVTAFRADYRPAADQPVDLVVRRRGPGDARGQGTEVLRRMGAGEGGGTRTDAQGELRLRVPVAAPGVYEVEATSNIVKGRTAKGIDLFVGSDTNPELEKVVGDDRLVSGIAKSTKGALLTFAAPLEEIPMEAPTVMRVKSRTHQELWDAPYALVLAALLFGFEWWLRRRYGYL